VISGKALDRGEYPFGFDAQTAPSIPWLTRAAPQGMPISIGIDETDGVHRLLYSMSVIAHKNGEGALGLSSEFRPVASIVLHVL
jgi:hypothetical protein